MNYRHAYHAGGFADVVKHAVLALVLEHLAAKDKPFTVLDTHAGIGRYDLSAPEAEKTGEFRLGILKVLDRPHEAMAPLLRVLAALNPGRAIPRLYPGSPELIARLARAQDRIELVELHPEDATVLAQTYEGDRRITVRCDDGYAVLKALLPPTPRRGLVLLDPPFEVEDEFARLTRAVRQAHRRFATGIHMAWYPIKDRKPVAAFHAALREAGIADMLCAELLVRTADHKERLNGCGLVIVNPPWRLDETLRALLPWLGERFGAARGAGTKITHLAPA